MVKSQMGASDWLFVNGIVSKILMNFYIYLFFNAANMEIIKLPTQYIKSKFPPLWFVLLNTFFAYPDIKNIFLYVFYMFNSFEFNVLDYDSF